MTSRKIAVRSRRRTVSGRKRSTRGLKLLLLLAVTGLSCYGAKRMDLKDYFAVRDVSLEGTRNLDKKDFLSLCRKTLLRRNMLHGLTEQAALLERQPLVRRVTLHRRFPDRVKVVVEEREPVALLNSGELLPVDREGYVLPLDGQARRTDLPILTPRRPTLESGDSEDSRRRLDKDGRMLLETSLAFRRMAPEVLPMISEFTLNEEGKVTLVTLNDGIEVVIGKWLRPETVQYLKWMMARLAEDGTKPGEVDLSFDGQIIVKDKKGI